MATRFSTRRILLAVSAAAAVLAAVSWWPRAPAPAPEAAAAAERPGSAVEARIVTAGPGVERTGPGGWVPARAGDALRVTDALRTGPGASAAVSIGDATLTVDRRSEVTVRELSAAAQNIRLVVGRIGVDHRPDGTRVLRVEDASGTIVASNAGGRWSVMAAGETLAVAVEEGTARVESAGAAVDVPAGSETAAWRGAAPLAPRPVPSALVLRVAQAVAERRQTVCAALRVDVASEVRVNGAPAPVGLDGRVLVSVARGARGRPVDVEVRHVTGAVERQTIRCAVEHADVTDMEVRWDAR